MPQHVIDGIARALDQHSQRGLAGSHILVMGAAYKKNIDDMRDSPSLHLIQILMERGAKVDYHDTYVPLIPKLHEFPNLDGLRSVPITPESLARYQAVVVGTDHDGVDYEMVATHANLAIDTRNIFGRLGLVADNIVKL